jgi:(2Fe-2S) ferredoxin
VNVQNEDVNEIIESHFKNSNEVERLLLPVKDK